MKFKAILLIILLIPVFLPKVSAQSPISITALNKTFYGLPGDVLIVPFNLTNLGNETISNVTVYIVGSAEGFLYQSRVIREPILPGRSLKDTISVKVLNADPGRYRLRIVAKLGKVYAEDSIVVTVGTVLDYEVGVNTKDAYIYGQDAKITLTVTSRSNGILTGRVGYAILGNNGTVENASIVTYILPEKSWTKTLTLEGLQTGQYTVRLWANFSGVYKETTRSFLVYRRNLTYTAYYRSGAIYIRVIEQGRGVSGIDVTVNENHLKTDANGMVEYPVTLPGQYTITLNLDGKVERTTITVKSLQLAAFQNGSKLVVRVVDSENIPVDNITVTATGPDGRDYSMTDEEGFATINLNRTGYGTILLRAESEKYLPVQATIMTVQPSKEVTPVTNITPTTTTKPQLTTVPSTTTTPKQRSSNYGSLAAILFVSGMVLAGTSYAAFFRPIVREEMLDRYYFVKVKAPKLRGMEGFRFEKGVSAVEARATKGKVEIKDGLIVWVIDHLEPEEEAYLQIVLG